MAIGERPCDGLIGCFGKFIGKQGVTLGGKEMQLVAKVFPLLRCNLCSLKRVGLGQRFMDSGALHLLREER